MTLPTAVGDGGSGLGGFLFDPNRCTGCAACSLACSNENGLGWGVSWRQIVSFNPERRPGVPSFHLSLACNHCDDAPCVAHCPTGAMRRDAATGAVVVDEARCIGCRYCAWVCPYDAPRFDAGRGVMTKCTLCTHRLREGGTPACVEACPTGALGFGPPAGAEAIPGFPVTPARPRIRFTPLRRDAGAPESTWALPADVAARFAAGREPLAPAGPPGAAAPAGPAPVTLSFGEEWPLWLLTSGLAGLAGWIGAAAWGAVRVPLLPFLALGVTLLASSALHLGRPLRAWRALAGLRSSALSREIGAVGAFLGASTLWIAWGGAGGPVSLPGAPGPGILPVLGTAAALLGLAALAAADRVYVPVRPPGPLHPADTVLTGPQVASVLLPAPWLFGALALVKLWLTLGPGRSPGGRAVPIALRIAAPAGVFALWGAAPWAPPWWPLLLFGAAELGARALFYRALAIPGPRGAARAAAAAWPAA